MLPGLSGRPRLREKVEGEIKAWVLARLPHRSDYANELSSKSSNDLLVIYLNWQARLVEARPRRVHRSKALAGSSYLADPAIRAALDQVAVKFELGHNVNPHLSERVLDGYRPKQSTGKRLTARRDLDMLLNDWGLHHLHLSMKVQPNGFVERTGPVLIAAVKSDEVYLVDIIKHGQWTDDQLVRIMQREWPDAGLVHVVNGTLPGNQKLSAEDRKNLRDAGISTFVELDDVVFLPGMGYSTAGTSTDAAMGAQRVLSAFKWFFDQLDADPFYVTKMMTANGLIPIGAPDLHFAVFDAGGYGVVERGSGFRIRLGE